MGARLARIFRNFNLENRALREISKEKPSAAPWHATEAPPSAVSSEGYTFGLPELTHVPKGKLTIAEALKALGSHQHQPRTWTAEKIAQDYSLDLKDTKSVVEFFIPFKVEVIPPKTRTAKQIKAS
ncbi:hypothetical protein XENOCAPTIV_010457 [Xenoophorus captivus]|uniref:NADH dehydrogenase [ubiquinone] 1 alpha subcomplex assembly factor 4 n=1 Tax=Xenoophorus captivus TaxID=1517983 RepID=A0ABV0QZW6_9TELE